MAKLHQNLVEFSDKAIEIRNSSLVLLSYDATVCIMTYHVFNVFIYGIDLLMAPKCLRSTGVDLWWFWHHHEQQTIDRPPFVQIPPKTAFINQKRMLTIVRTCLEFLWRCWLQRCAQNRWFWHLNLTRFVCQSCDTITISNWIDNLFYKSVAGGRSRERGHFLRSRTPSM